MKRLRARGDYPSIWAGEVSSKCRQTLCVDPRTVGVPFLTLVGIGNFPEWGKGPEMHVHAGNLEISFCDRGQLTLETREGRASVLPGMAFAMPCDRPHHYLNVPKGARIYTALVPMGEKTVRLPGLPSAIGESLVRRLRALPTVFALDARAVRRVFERFADEVSRTEPDAALRRFRLHVAGENLLLALLDVQPDDVSNRSLHALVERWAERMRKHPEDEFPIREMLSGQSVGERDFLRTFRDVTGYNPKAYHTICRVRRAEELLAAGQSVTATADRLGYCSPQHFATVFRKTTGKSPRDFA